MSDGEIPISENPANAKSGTDPNLGWGLAEVAIGVVVAMLIGVVCIIGYQQLVDDSTRITLPRLFSGLVGGWIAYAGVPYLVTRHLPGRLRGQLGLRFDLKKDIPKGILLGIAGQILVAVVYLPLYVFHSDLADKIDDPARQLSEAMSGWRWLVFGFFVGVVSPICEELFFRGLTLKAIAHRWGPVVGIVGSGIVFGIIHFEGLQTIALAAFGMLLAWRATRTGRIGETIIGHGVFNLITVLALITGAS